MDETLANAEIRARWITVRVAIVLMLVGLTPAPDAAAQQAGATPTALASHQRGDYEATVSLGLAELLAQPWNHHLRFVVADSLQRLGRLNEAIAQLEALEGTSYAQTAAARLQLLREAAHPAPQPVPAAPRSQAQVPGSFPQFLPALPQYVTPSGTTAAVPPGPAMPAPPSPPAQAARPAPASTAARATPAQRILELVAAQRYREAGAEGLALIAVEPPEDAVRLQIGNSLAWTGRHSEAIAVYEGLLSGPLANEARVGLANVYRWRGMAEQSVPLYNAVLASEPEHVNAQQGIRLAQRELRPRTSFTLGAFEDSSGVVRRSAVLNHRWRDGGGPNIAEVELSRVADRQAAIKASEPALTLRYHARDLQLKPSLELGLANGGGRNLYGSVRLHVGQHEDVVELGRVNWGVMATNPNALLAGLSANHLGLQASREFDFGRLTGRLDYFDISDGNSIIAGGLRLAVPWRPLGPQLKPFVGVETRNARFTTGNYWAPATGYGSLYGGLLAEWEEVDWNLYASGQVGTRLFGEAGTSWSLATGGKRWLSNDIGVGFSLWSMSSQRNNAAYRANALNLSLEKLW